MKYDKQRLFEVTARLDKTFKPKLNEEIEIDAEVGGEEMPDTGQAPDFKDMPEPTEMPDEEGVAEKSPEEKLAELTAKVDELHAMLHGGDEAEEMSAEDIPVDDSPAEEVPVEPEAGEEEEVSIETLEEESIAVEEPVDGTGIEKPVNEEEVPVAAVAKVGEAK